MPPRLNLRPIVGRSKTVTLKLPTRRPADCLLCALSTKATRPSRSARHDFSRATRAEYTTAAPDGTRSSNGRRELEEALVKLQQHAANYVNSSRIQLAIRGLRQQPGQETVRVAILGLANGSASRSAKELVRLMLADPLKPQGEWEADLDRHDTAKPLVIRLRRQEPAAQHHTLELAKDSLLPEIDVSSATLNGNNIELLVMEMDPTEAAPSESGSITAFEEAVLVPTVEIPISESGRYTRITTPVHRALIVADGILGATSVAGLTSLYDHDEIATAINLRRHDDDTSSCPFMTVDVSTGAQAIAAFREGVEHAMKYEALWSRSNLPAVLDWLKLGALNNAEGHTKEPIRKLIASVLRNARSSIQEQQANQLSIALASSASASNIAALNTALADWAEAAHAELQDQLDAAFTSRRWRKLGWWKLFWRVDDVSMLSSEMVVQRFLPGAENEVIYLAGRIEEAMSLGNVSTQEYAAPVVAASPLVNDSKAAEPNPPPRTKWPSNIPFTRRYLLDETIPALQALAQKLVLQTLGTSATTTSLATLMYLSSFGGYESGAVGALGLVWSLGRMQKKWETARDFWEGEVREEGRKAVRSVEASVALALDRPKERGQEEPSTDDLSKAEGLVQNAEDALSKLL